MTINTTLPPAIASVDDDPQFNLENALTNIHGLAHVIMALATSDSVEEDELSYLGGQLIRHEEAAQDAMCRILKIGDYRERRAPAQVPAPLADDAAFLAAEQELLDVKRQKAALDEHEHPVEHEELGDRMHGLEDLIGNSPPHSLVSVAVKLRRLAAPEGIDAGPADSDVAAVHQVHAFVEKLIAEGCEMSARDPVPALVAERMKIWDIAERDGHSEQKLKKLGEQYGALDNRIADIVAPSVAGILAQFELLMELTEPAGWSDNRDRRLMEAIKAGLRNLTGGAK